MTETKTNWRIPTHVYNSEKDVVQIVISRMNYNSLIDDLDRLDTYEKARNYLKEFLGVY